MLNTRATLTGHSIIAGQQTPGNGSTIYGSNPATNTVLEPAYTLIDYTQLAFATAAAEEAFASFSTLDPETHAAFLEQIATNIEAIREELIERAMAETGLPRPRLTGETSRTIGQLRLFAAVVRQGDFRAVRIDPALPERTPAPRVDLRQRAVPLGAVAVFGASNFPLAFSTAGGDTASALAAGCPVVFKAHNAHPGTSELTGRAIADAVASFKLHPGVFSLIYGAGSDIGQALVADPVIKAVGFTGSRSGGLALSATAAARKDPIPVYAEMSALNPVFVFPGALRGDSAQSLAAAYITSVTGSSGQLCTAPGIVFVPEGADGDRFTAMVANILESSCGSTMLTTGICAAWNAGVEQLGSQGGVTLIGSGSKGETRNAPAPVVYGTDLATFLDNPVLHEEIFGAASLLIRYDTVNDLVSAAAQLEGQLTATMHFREEDYPSAATLLPILERKAGRILANGWPTGVEVGHAMVHGGPFPATSNARSTSVGSLAIERFLRPVAYQDLPECLLPAPVQATNPWQLRRMLDGVLE